ncbi:sugar phosphate isomerase/epimerase family protein [Falsigemmobacter faecalis]|uniref:Sugar phosphate isomerase/epimerase n=1 Tax=Falsigemmobacter faecalis TaxID=2488730 RepID=A0A3P3DFY0_9RHOB|nr:sugar phosphate isomerase/epimerase family protein [Falsigemmobacter faecalis]RRH73187.1 sugar phosphate isomerase/epimerase [Falsigemmobacter faecalis]
MKLAYMYATPEVAPAKVTAIQGDPEHAFAAIAAEGFSGVELLVRDPRAFDHDRLEAQIRAAGLEMPAVCTGEVYGEDLLSFADPDPARRAEAIERMLSAMDFAARFGAMVNVGRLRGRYRDDVPADATEALILDAFRTVADARPDTRVVLEPVNHLYANYLTSTAAACDFADLVARPNVGLMLDMAHITIEGEAHAESLAAAGDRLWHYHITDSDRLACGEGTWDIGAALDELRATGFDGWITAEHFQSPDAMSAMRQSARWLAEYRAARGL